MMTASELLHGAATACQQGAASTPVRTSRAGMDEPALPNASVVLIDRHGQESARGALASHQEDTCKKRKTRCHIA